MEIKAPDKRQVVFYVRTKKEVRGWWEGKRKAGKWKSMAEFFEAMTNHLKKNEERKNVGRKK